MPTTAHSTTPEAPSEAPARRKRLQRVFTVRLSVEEALILEAKTRAQNVSEREWAARHGCTPFFVTPDVILRVLAELELQDWAERLRRASEEQGLPVAVRALVALLSPERTPVAQLWAQLGITRAELQALITAYRDDLAAAGVLLHTATVSQASATRLYLTVGEYRIAALSQPEGGR